MRSLCANQTSQRGKRRNWLFILILKITASAFLLARRAAIVHRNCIKLGSIRLYAQHSTHINKMIIATIWCVIAYARPVVRFGFILFIRCFAMLRWKCVDSNGTIFITFVRHWQFIKPYPWLCVRLIEVSPNSIVFAALAKVDSFKVMPVGYLHPLADHLCPSNNPPFCLAQCEAQTNWLLPRIFRSELPIHPGRSRFRVFLNRHSCNSM